MAGVVPLPQIQVGFNFQMSFGEEWKCFYFILLMQQKEDKHENKNTHVLLHSYVPEFLGILSSLFYGRIGITTKVVCPNPSWYVL